MPSGYKAPEFTATSRDSHAAALRSRLLVLIVFVVANAVLMLALSHLLSTYRRTPPRSRPTNRACRCWATRGSVLVKFYLVAMLFIIFDIETVFMIPWAVAFRQLTEISGLLIIEMFIFIAILAVGYVYIWKRGALQWD